MGKPTEVFPAGLERMPAVSGKGQCPSEIVIISIRRAKAPLESGVLPQGADVDAVLTLSCEGGRWLDTACRKSGEKQD